MSISERVATRWLKTAMSVGETYENEKWRVHRYADHVEATDLTNAGRRGKKVQRIVMLWGYSRVVPAESLSMEVAMNARKKVDLSRMMQVFNEAQDTFAEEGLKVSVEFERGVDVMPGGFNRLKVLGPHVAVEVDYNSFMVRDKDDMDNMPMATNTDRVSLPIMYRWVQDNEARIKSMKYRDVLHEMDAMGIKYHDYCAMD